MSLQCQGDEKAKSQGEDHGSLPPNGAVSPSPPASLAAGQGLWAASRHYLWRCGAWSIS